MNANWFRIALFALVAAALLAPPAGAQVIPAGPDNWRTADDGLTFYTFPPGDVESLCGRPATFDWDRRTSLRGVPTADGWDTSVIRLKDAVLAPGETVTVPIVVEHLEFVSSAPHCTPCGKIKWRVRAPDGQPQTFMQITQESALGGTFNATISVQVVFDAFTLNGTYLGSLFYTVDLPDAEGSPWSWGGPTGWQPGIDPDDNSCVQELREKIGTLPSHHAYYIEEMIAQGRCDGRPN